MIRQWLQILCLAWIAHPVAWTEETTVRILVLDAASGDPMAANLKLVDSEGEMHFFTSDEVLGSAVAYDKTSSINVNSREAHTTVSAHRMRANVRPGHYQLTVSRGQNYIPVQRAIQIDTADVALQIELSRWSNPNARGWYSGDIHLHRPMSELPNVVMAEDINVTMPLTYWVLKTDTLPMQSERSKTDPPGDLIKVDEHHVIWPRNTEYEIFDIGTKQHVLGALFVLGHQEPLATTAPPWGPTIKAAREADPSVLFDMDKLDWYDAMVLPPLAPDSLYELSNNHVWRTEFAYRNWYTFAPAYIHPPYGSTTGGHRQWIDYTLGTYYTLLNCGFRLPPSAGTANGVHPVPAGFSRVYVHLTDEFSFESWREGLQAGRSFVSTGPMLYATANGQDPGHIFEVSEGDLPKDVAIEMEVLSLNKLLYGELLFNGRPMQLLRAQNKATEQGGYRTKISTSIRLKQSGWFAIRFWEPHEDGQSRFAHTAPWYAEVDGSSPAPTDAQKQYLIARMRHSMNRSRGVISDEAFVEYENALSFYQSMPTEDDSETVRRQSRPLTQSDRHQWLANMIVDHQFTRDEVRLATGMSTEQAQAELDRLQKDTDQRKAVGSVQMRPYPGGRHPRRGFLEGAIDPQRETKVSLFAPWADGGYVVVDVPEAVFSDLGLTYLAHTHIPTIWDEQKIRLPPIEWKGDENQLMMTRALPNGIVIESTVDRVKDGAEMTIELRNGTSSPLTKMRVQVCAMLKATVGFNAQEELDQVIDGPLVAIRGQSQASQHRWIITGWVPHDRAWTNPPVPCVHSDPVLPDCLPGASVRARGGLWFYEGTDLHSELKRRLLWLEN